MSHARTKIIVIILSLIVIAAIAGCKKSEPARLMVEVEGEFFSDALLFIDGKQVGKLTKTLIRADGQMFIDDIYRVTLPPEHKDVPSQDQCSGALDSLEMRSGKYALLLQNEEGKSLQINATLKPGLNVIVYNADQHVIKLNDVKMNAAPGTTVNFP
jgi:hypothetical protein